MKFADSWFEDEVRNGFYIPSIMKRNWAAHMKLLEEIAQVCEKHQIRWFICAGTLLGAVRHKGFIPWDDDIDLYMLREDFVKFKAVAMQELPEGYCWLDPRKEENCFLTNKVANSVSLILPPETRAKFYGHPYQVHIDTFILDSISPDEEGEMRRKLLDRMVQLALAIITEQIAPHSDLDALIKEIEKLSGKKLNQEDSMKDQLFDLFEEICQCKLQVKGKSPKEVSLIPYYVYGNNERFPSEVFSSSVLLPFEGMELQAPVGYEVILHNLFGDYMQFKKSGGLRGYPYYSPIEDAAGTSPNSKHVFPRIQTNDQRAEAARQAWSSSADRARSKAGILGKLQLLLEQAIVSNDAESVLKVLELCQKTAIDLGTLLEDTAGEEMSGTVELLEHYCDTAYQIYAAIVG